MDPKHRNSSRTKKYFRRMRVVRRIEEMRNEGRSIESLEQYVPQRQLEFCVMLSEKHKNVTPHPEKGTTWL